MKNFFTLLCTLIALNGFSQEIINGDFELTTATGDLINLSNTGFNDVMPNCNSFGTQANLDILNSTNYATGPQSGEWYIGFTGGDTDLMTMELSEPLEAGTEYTMTFYAQSNSGFNPDTIRIGLSMTNDDAGIEIYSTPDIAVVDVWTEYTFEFVAPGNGQYISISQDGGISNWIMLDNFSLATVVSTNPELEEAKAMRLVQNPVADYLNLEFDTYVENASLSIVSSAGSMVFNQNYEGVENLNIDVANLPAGAYFVVMQQPGEAATTLKFMKM